jgi:CRP/FNR family transcriptional regulator, cyclic AMP receptor protein
MARKQPPGFNPKIFLATVGKGKTLLTSLKKTMIFSQGDAADAVFYIQEGQVKSRSRSCPNKAKKPLARFCSGVTFWGKGASPGSWCTWPRRPPWKTPLSCVLTNRR